MANFPCNPMIYVPMGLHIKDGWLHLARSRVALGGEPPRRHEQYSIIRLLPEPAQDQVINLIQDVSDFLEDEFPVRVVSAFPSPLGLGLFQFDSPVQRQILLDASPIPFAHGSVVVQRHDEAMNLRACNYIKQCWVMFLAFPLDYQTLDFIKAAVAPLGRLLHWFDGANKSRILTQCLVISPERVPRSVVVSQGSVNGGFGRSWSVPVFILDGHFPDAFPADEDPVPYNGNPHPWNGPVHNINVNAPQHWHHEQMGGQQGDQMDHGINDQHWQAAQEDLAIHDADGVADQGWDAWPEPEADNMDAPIVQQVPQHPDQTQDTASFDQSGSTAEYLRAIGPDIVLTVEDVLKGKYAASTSQDEVISVPIPMIQLIAAFQIWEDTAFQRLGLGPIRQPQLPTPILDRFNLVLPNISTTMSQQAPVESLAIIPYRTTLAAVMIQLWATAHTSVGISDSSVQAHATLPSMQSLPGDEDSSAQNIPGKDAPQGPSGHVTLPKTVSISNPLVPLEQS
ncbi:unnamed protein product [Urochloa humidicola]